MCLLLTFLLYGLSAAMGCTPARSATVMGDAEGRAVLATDMGVKLGWWLTEGVNPGVPFTLQDTREFAAAAFHTDGVPLCWTVTVDEHDVLQPICTGAISVWAQQDAGVRKAQSVHAGNL
jgi:hypothetical protein